MTDQLSRQNLLWAVFCVVGMLCVIVLFGVILPAGAAADSPQDAANSPTNDVLGAEWEQNFTEGARGVAASENTIYVTTTNYSFGGGSSIVAFGTDGQHRWTNSLSGSLEDTPSGKPAAGPDGAVYVSHQKGVVAYESDGTKRWDTSNLSCNCGSSSRPLVTEHAVYVVVEQDGRLVLHALDPDTGSTSWSDSLTQSSSVPSDPLSAGANDIYVGLPRAGLFAYSQAGEQQFQRSFPTSLTNRPVATPNETVLVPTTQGLYAVNTQNASTAWGIDTGSNTLPAVGSDGTIVAPTATNQEYTRNYGVEIRSPSGSLLAGWQQSTLNPGELDIRKQPVLTEAGTAFFAGGSLSSQTNYAIQKNGELVQDAVPDTDRQPGLLLDTGRILFWDSTGMAVFDTGTDSPSVPVNASLSVNDRFPTPEEPLVVSANGSTGVGTLSYDWSVNGTESDCSQRTCEFDVEYPATISVSVTDAEGRTDTTSTTVHASDMTVTVVDDVPTDVFGEVDVLTDRTVTIEANTSKINHHLEDITWSVPKSAEQTPTGSHGIGATFTDGGPFNVTATATVTDPATGNTTNISTSVTGAAFDYQDSLDRYTFRFEGAADSYQGRIAAAKIQDRLPTVTPVIEQRTDGLPDEMTIALVHPETRDGCLICGGDGTIFYRVDIGISTQTLRHELTHLAQDYMNTEQDGDWKTLIEGHAMYEEDAYVSRLDEKPTRAEFLNWDGSYTDYQEGGHFMATFAGEYGRQKLLELFRNSLNQDLQTRFQAVTGDSFQEFYEEWDPVDGSRSIRLKPGFIHQNGRLAVVGSSGVCTSDACSIPDSVEISWDIDDDGTFERSGPTVSWVPKAGGEYPITLQYAQNGSSIQQTQVLELDGRTQITIIGDETPTDVDDDGKLEDINGDGTFDIVDVNAFYQHYQSDAVQSHPAKFDYTGNGGVDIVDVNYLFNTIQD